MPPPSAPLASPPHLSGALRFQSHCYGLRRCHRFSSAMPPRWVEEAIMRRRRARLRLVFASNRRVDSCCILNRSSLCVRIRVCTCCAYITRCTFLVICGVSWACDVSTRGSNYAQRRNKSSSISKPATRISIPAASALRSDWAASFVSGSAASVAVSDGVHNQPGRLSSRHVVVLPVPHRGAFKVMTNCGCDGVLSGGRTEQRSHLHDACILFYSVSKH